MSREYLQIPVEYLISTTSDWTKFHIVEGGWWSDVKVECLKGCDKLRLTRVIDNKIISIDKGPGNTDLVRVKAKCTLNIDKTYLGSNISYLITKGDLKLTSVRINVQGKEIERKSNRHNIEGNPKNPFSFEVPTSLHVSAIRERETEIDYGEIETRAGRFTRYERLSNFLTQFWALAFLIGLGISSLATTQLFGRQPQNWETYVSVGLVSVPWVLSAYIAGKKRRKYRVEDDEWAILYTNLIADNLKKRSNTRSLDLKKDYRKKAVKNAKDFHSCIKKRWKIGRFKLAKDYFGDSISELKKNIQYRVIPSLKDGDDESLKKINKIMRNFLVKSRSLDLKGINSINEEMSSRLDEIKTIRFRDRLSTFFSTHTVAKHGLFISTLSIGSCVFYAIAVTYLGISKNYSFGGSVAIFLGLLTIYFTKQPKE